MAQQTTFFHNVNCRSFPLGQRESQCLEKILGPQYQQYWRVCQTSGDGFCMMNSATDFMKKPAYKERAQQLKQHFRAAFQQWKKDDRNAALALALQNDDGMSNLINQIDPAINDMSYELILLLPYPPFNMNYILIENVALSPDPFILFLSQNQVNQRPFEDVYALFSQWFKNRYSGRPRLRPIKKQDILKKILSENDLPWRNSLLLNEKNQLIYTKQKLLQNFPTLKPQYKCETQMNTETFNPNLPTLIFYLPGGHFSRLESLSVKVKVQFIQKQYEEKTGKQITDDMVQSMMVAENERLKIFNNKMVSNNPQPPAGGQKPKNNQAQGILPQPLPQSKIGIEQYLNHLLTVIEGFLLGILQKKNQETNQNKNKRYDIHNKEEAKRLLSIFDNDFRKQQNNFSSSVRNGFNDRYKNMIEILANLEAIEQLKVKLHITQEETQKQKIRNNILKLETLIPQAYKNNVVPTSGGFTLGSIFSFFGKPNATTSPQAATGKQQQQPPAVPPPVVPPVVPPPAVQSKEQYNKIFKQLQEMGAQFTRKKNQLKHQYNDLETRNNNKQFSPQKYQQQKTALNRKQQKLKLLQENLKKKQQDFLKLKVPQDWKKVQDEKTLQQQEKTAIPQPPFDQKKFMKKRQELQVLRKQYQNGFIDLKNRYNDLETRKKNNQISEQKYQQQKAILNKEKQQVLRPIRQNMEKVWAQFLNIKVPQQLQQKRSQLLQKQEFRKFWKDIKI